jgi:hypothetical protein
VAVFDEPCDHIRGTLIIATALALAFACQRLLLAGRQALL